MTEFKKFPGVTPDGSPTSVTIVAGPVIVQDGKVLVVKHGSDDGWKFPGGKLRDDNSPQENARREVLEELNLQVEISGEPFIVSFVREKNGAQEFIILIHYRATIVSGELAAGRDVREVAWLPVDALPEDSMPNIKAAAKFFTQKL